MEQDVTFDTANEERVLVLTPRRNIETWIRFLGEGDERVDEETDYHPVHRGRESECRPQADRLAAACKKQKVLPESMPSSLKQACEECHRRFGQWL
jgi:hypothetical protein